MSIFDFIEEYKNLSQKEMALSFNKFSVDERKNILDLLSKDDKEKFINIIRKQAVKDFWTHEQALIKEGKCTRDWSPEQIEDILNISEKTGVMSINGEAAVDF